MWTWIWMFSIALTLRPRLDRAPGGLPLWNCASPPGFADYTPKFALSTSSRWIPVLTSPRRLRWWPPLASSLSHRVCCCGAKAVPLMNDGALHIAQVWERRRVARPLPIIEHNPPSHLWSVGVEHARPCVGQGAKLGKPN